MNKTDNCNVINNDNLIKGTRWMKFEDWKKLAFKEAIDNVKELEKEEMKNNCEDVINDS